MLERNYNVLLGTVVWLVTCVVGIWLAEVFFSGNSCLSIKALETTQAADVTTEESLNSSSATTQAETTEIKRNGFYNKGGYRYYYKKGKMLTSQMVTVKGETYYCKANGRLKKGWLKYKGNRYYFYDNYKMAKNVILENKYKIGKNGKLLETFSKDEVKARKVAEAVVKKAVKKGMSKSEKLWAAYQYVVKHTYYSENTPCAKGSKDWEAKCAFKTLTTGAGECYGFAAAFTYMAKVIGYEEAKVCYGSTMSASYPWSPHGWAEIKISGTTYLFDPEIEYKNGTCGRLYKKQYSQVARKYKKEN